MNYSQQLQRIARTLLAIRGTQGYNIPYELLPVIGNLLEEHLRPWIPNISLEWKETFHKEFDVNDEVEDGLIEERVAKISNHDQTETYDLIMQVYAEEFSDHLYLTISVAFPRPFLDYLQTRVTLNHPYHFSHLLRTKLTSLIQKKYDAQVEYDIISQEHLPNTISTEIRITLQSDRYEQAQKMIRELIQQDLNYYKGIYEQLESIDLDFFLDSTFDSVFEFRDGFRSVLRFGLGLKPNPKAFGFFKRYFPERIQTIRQRFSKKEPSENLEILNRSLEAYLKLYNQLVAKLGSEP